MYCLPTLSPSISVFAAYLCLYVTSCCVWYHQVDVLHVSATAKNAADDKLKLRMQEFGNKNSKQAMLILISGDVNFAPVLNMLKYSHQVYVVLIHNRQASSTLTSLADEKYVFDEFLADIPSRPIPVVSSY